MADDEILNQINTVLGSMPTSQPFSSQTVWPARLIMGASPGGGGGQGYYTGPGLVGFSNTIEEDNYVITEGLVRDVYSQMTPAERQTRLGILKEYGYYGNRNVGDPDADLRAIEQWLDESNLAGVTRERYLTEIIKNRPKEARGGGAPRRYRVSNPDDLKAVFKRVAQETIGRGFSDEEASQAVAAYQQREIQAQQAMYAGGTMTEQPAADVFAQQFAQQVAPTEANGYKFLGYMNQLFQAAGGR